MNKIQIIPEKISQKLLIILLAILPFNFLWFPISLVFLGAVVVFSKETSKNFLSNSQSFYKNYLILNTSFYILIALYTILAPDKKLALLNAQEKLALLIIPLFFAAFDFTFIKKNYKILLYSFIIGLFIATLLSYYHSFMQALVQKNDGSWILNLTGDSEMKKKGFWELVHLRYCYFGYSYLSSNIHVSYYALFLNFGIAFLWTEIKSFLAIKNKLKLILISLLALYFIFFVYLLQSRAGLITIAILILFFFIEAFWKLKKLRITILSLAAISIIFIAYLFANSKLYTNLQEIEHKSNQVDDRFYIWKASLDLIKENPIIGYGTASQKIVVKNKMNKLYPQITEKRPQYDDPHNQFLAFWIQNGILGLLFFLFEFFYMYRISFKQKNQLLFYLTTLVLVNVLFESMFERSIGLIFIMLFSSLLIIQGESKTTLS